MGKKANKITSWIFSLGLGLIPMMTLGASSQAAEKIYFIYSPLMESLKIDSLKSFAETGNVPLDLKFYLDIVGADAEERQLLQTALTRKIDIDPVLLARSLKTDEGERLLESFGQVVNIRGGRNGKYALRGAIIKSAFEENGLTLLNVLDNLGVDVQVDLEQLFGFAENVSTILAGTERFIEEVEQLAKQEAKFAAVADYGQRPDLRKMGMFAVEMETWQLADQKRDRQFYAQIYRPQKPLGEKVPVILISHGLASAPEKHRNLAQHLASYGFVVVVPQHPGSDLAYLEEFAVGYQRQVSDLQEFVNRPLDISFTLDELERRNDTEFGGRLDLENVGIYGHSYGGYTALAVAGAFPTPNFEQLNEDCAAEWGIFNNALLLQCRALQLSPENYNFRDQRIQAVIAANPVNASIFGEAALSQIEIPIAVVAGSYDPATPFIFEQVRSFPWIRSEQKYLILEEGQAHVDISRLDLGITGLLDRIPRLNLPSPQLLNDYSEAIALAFFQVYTAEDNQYRAYLDPAYGQYLSQNEEFKTFMITQDSLPELEAAIAEFKQENQIDIN